MRQLSGSGEGHSVRGPATGSHRLPFSLEPRELVDLGFDAIVVRSPSDRRILYWSPGAERLYGWPADEALGETDVVQTEPDQPFETIREELERRGRWEGLVRQRRRDERPITVLARWSLHRDGEGRPDAIVEVNTDVTRQVRAEHRLGASQEMFRLLVESVRDYAIFMLDPTGHIASWNAGAERIKGYTAADIIGQHFSVFYPESDVRAGKPDWELLVAEETGRFEDEGWRVRKDGSRFWANVVITALRDETGSLRGFGKVTRDLTTRREAELERLDRERRQADAARAVAARVTELEKTKTEFLNLASHELRGPLAVARGYISLLLDGSLTPQAFAQHAPLVGGKLAQIEALVGKMLETARLDYGQLSLSMSTLDIRTVVQDQVDAMRAVIGPRHDLNLRIQPSLPPVRGDRDRLGAAIGNLLDNAIKYSPDGGRIDVGVAASKTRVFVSVRDEGIGIDPEDVPKLFTRFSRLNVTETANIGGTGLGLYLAREIARRHGGDIIVVSRPHEGSQFTLSLPIAESRRPPADEER